MFVSVNITGPRPRSGGGRKLAEIFDGRGEGEKPRLARCAIAVDRSATTGKLPESSVEVQNGVQIFTRDPFRGG